MAKAPIRKEPSKAVRLRVWVQAAFLLVWLGPFGLRMLQVCGPVYHCYACPLATFGCPIGTMAQFSAMHIVPFATIGVLLLVGGLVGGFVCGWACPFGFFQDLLGRIPTRRFVLPSWTGYFRYVVLVATVLVIPYLFGKDHPLFICSICPAGAIEAGIPNMVSQAAAGQPVTWPNALKLGLLAVLVVAVFFKHRPWCTLLCPLGAIFGLFNHFAVVRMKVDRRACVSCGACTEMCRYGVRPEKSLSDPACIRCLECTRCEAIKVAGAFSRRAAADEPARPGETPAE